MTVRFPRLPLSLDPLIAEARQRARRRRLLLAALLAGVLALAVGLSFGLRHTGPRLEAFRSSSGRWVPAGVEEIDVRAPNSPPVSLRVTDPSQVKQIVGWFNGLTANRPGSSGCAGGYAPNVSFTFRGASGRALATAYSSPLPTGSCDPIYFKAGAKPHASLFDPNDASSFITRVRQLLGISRTSAQYRG
jgi:hypothetical protein